MADDPKKKEEKKDDKKPGKDAKAPAPDPKAVAAAAAAAAGAGKSGLISIILGVVVLVAVGAGAGMYIVKSLAPASVPKPGTEAAAGKGGDPHDPHGKGSEAGATPAIDPNDKGLLANGVELGPIPLKANITSTGGTRFVTLSVGVWVPKLDKDKLSDASVMRLIQSCLEESLTTFQLQDLQSPTIRDRMKTIFGAAIEKRLRAVIPLRPPNEKFVLDITPTELLTQ